MDNNMATLPYAFDIDEAGPGIQPSFPVTATGTGAPASQFTAETSNDNLSGKAVFQMDFSDDVMAYVPLDRAVPCADGVRRAFEELKGLADTRGFHVLVFGAMQADIHSVFAEDALPAFRALLVCL